MTKIKQNELKYQKWFWYSYDIEKTMMLPAKRPLLRCSASGTKEREERLPEFKLMNQRKFCNCGMSLEYARLTWPFYLADSTDVKAILTSEEQYALTKPACLIASAALAIVVISAESLPSSSAMASDEKD